MYTSSLDGPITLRDIAAVVLSIVCPGLGHAVAGQVHKGMVIFGLTLLSCGFGYFVSALVAIDAFLVSRAQRTREVGPWECLPGLS
jgi:hypothetical protein